MAGACIQIATHTSAARRVETMEYVYESKCNSWKKGKAG